jgi:hypothetical protein
LQGRLGTFGVRLAEPGDLNSIEFNADFSDAGDILQQFRDLSVEQILDIVRSFIDRLKDSSDLAFMNYEIPVVNTSLNDVIVFIDDVFVVIDEFIYNVDTEAAEAACDALSSAISNLPVPPEEKTDLIRAVSTAYGVLRGESGSMATRLLSSFGEIRRAIENFSERDDFDDIAQQIRDELDDALEAFGLQVPSLNSMTQRLSDGISDYLQEYNITL